VVKRVPSSEEILAVQNEIDGVLVVLWVKEGDRLSHFADTDSYSFEYANIFIGGKDEKDLIDKYQRTMQKGPFDVEPMSAQAQ
jgi:hypothetical protein